MPEYYPDLLNAIKEDCLVIFAGAGTSIDLGLPSWKGLIIEALHKTEEINESYKHFERLIEKDLISPVQALEFLETNDYFKKNIMDTLRNLNKKVYDVRDFPLQQKILGLTRKIVTTNYDKAFERASNISDVIEDEDPYHMANLFKRDEFIWKIHGDLDRPVNCVLFEEQYVKKYVEGAYLLSLQFLFVQKTVLFVGFSLTDPYIERIIRAISKFYNFFNTKHYIITNDQSIETKYGGSIKSILIRDHKEIYTRLEELIYYKQNGVLPSPQADATISFTSINYKLRRKYTNLIGREKQLEELINCIDQPNPITVIHGLPGVGKSSLATEVAFICIGQSTIKVSSIKIFEAIVYIPLDEYGGEQNLLSWVLDEIGRQTNHIKVPQTSLIEERGDPLIEKIRQVDGLLHKNEVLIFLDNFELNRDKALNNWLESIDVQIRSEILITTQQIPNFRHTLYRLGGLDEQSALEFMRQEAKAQGVELGRFGLPENLSKIFVATDGKPYSMNLAIGHIKKGALSLSELNQDNTAIKSIFRAGYKKPWEKLSVEAKTILSIFALFKGPIHRDALCFISNFRNEEFDNAITELYGWNLLTVNIEEQYYSLHSTLLKFLEDESKNYNQYKEGAIKSKFIEHYLNLVKKTIERIEPKEPYWNTLVSNKMEHLEVHWASIVQAINWAKEDASQNSTFLQLITLLVHYMDSRFYNYERITYVKHAITICEDLKEYYLEALLLIDALGWTYVEEDMLVEAEASITEGLKILGTKLVQQETSDLKALAYAWLARTKVEKNTPDFGTAKKLIQDAEKYKGKAWIRSRILQAAGDISYKECNYREALEKYTNAKDESNTYKGEGNDYRMNPRIGLAYLSNGDIDKAEEMFSMVCNNTAIYINKLYGDYGLALVKFNKNRDNPEKVKVVCDQLKRIEDDILKRSNSNVLLKLIREYKSRNLNGQDS